jgi:hypothetical protein
MYLILFNGIIKRQEQSKQDAALFLLKHFGCDEYNRLIQRKQIVFLDNAVGVNSEPIDIY